MALNKDFHMLYYHQFGIHIFVPTIGLARKPQNPNWNWAS